MFRNREIQRFAVLFLVITAFTVFCQFAVHPAAGKLALLSAGIYGAVFFLFTRKRYQAIARISEQIDQVLHNADRLFIGKEEEGELSILRSEITKMTIRIQEQNDSLRKEKESLADSMADIAHQLRTPLTSANLILSLLKDSKDKYEQRELLREMDELLVRMDWLITSLLKLARLDAGIIVFEQESLSVKELVHAAWKPLLISMDLHNISLQERLIDNVKIYGDESWLLEAIQNVLKNCMDSAGDGGTIEIACEDTPLFTEIIIHDSGKGIAPEDLPHVFDRFYQGKHSGTAGYGIGLALCKKIVTGQGGTIIAKNHPLGGAVFVFRFPKEPFLLK